MLDERTHALAAALSQVSTDSSEQAERLQGRADYSALCRLAFLAADLGATRNQLRLALGHLRLEPDDAVRKS